MKLFFEKVNKSNRGFTLVETLVAVSIFTMSLLSIMSVLASSIASTNYAKNKMVASYLAQEGIEYVKNMRDTYVLYTLVTGWDDFNNADKDYPTDLPGFTRTITVEEESPNELKITSEVTWNQVSGQKSVTLSANLFNYWGD